LGKVFASVAPHSTEQPPAATKEERAIEKVRVLYGGRGRHRADFSRGGGGLGLLNCVTEYVDHYCRARFRDRRHGAALFGQGAVLRNRAFATALELIR
jgi:hypothetical protein